MHCVDIWVDSFSNLEHLYEKREILNINERKRLEKKYFNSDKKRYAISYIYLRYILSYYYPTISKEEWVFDYSPFGKPFIKNKLPEPVYFNMSRTKNHLAVIVSKNYKVGIDIESTQDLDVDLHISKIFLTNNEQKLLSGANSKQIFYTLWTLKEAYLKAVGTGLNPDIKNLNFSSFIESLNKQKYVNVFSNYFHTLYNSQYSISCVVLNTTTQIDIIYKNINMECML